MTKGHGGEDVQVVPPVCLNQSDTLPEIKSNSKLTSKKDKSNTMDKIINTNVCSTNDIHDNELKVTTNVKEMKEPTPVTYFSVLKNSDNRLKVKYEGLTVLFDSGSSHTMIVEKVVQQQQWKRLHNPVGFDSCNGAFELNYKTDIKLTFPELNSHRVVKQQCYIDERKNNELGYDMIVGRDLMTSLGIQLDFQDKKLKWDGAELE